jgi:Kef-type K+ transport system membrane component KefB
MAMTAVRQPPIVGYIIAGIILGPSGLQLVQDREQVTLVIRAISFNFRIFDVDPLLQPLIEGMVLLAAVSLGAARVFRVRNRLELFG